MKRTEEELPAGKHLRYASDAFDAAQDADALLVLTDWAEFAAIDLSRLYTTLRYPIVIDGRNLYDPTVMQDHGFTYLSIGRPPPYPHETYDGAPYPNTSPKLRPPRRAEYSKGHSYDLSDHPHYGSRWLPRLPPY